MIMIYVIVYFFYINHSILFTVQRFSQCDKVMREKLC